MWDAHNWYTGFKNVYFLISIIIIDTEKKLLLFPVHLLLLLNYTENV